MLVKLSNCMLAGFMNHLIIYYNESNQGFLMWTQKKRHVVHIATGIFIWIQIR